jgi:GPH family glycoside/pentoside/hexuronide:cation symporter
MQEYDRPSATPERLSFFKKCVWSFGSVADQFMTNGINSLAMPIYCISLGLDVRLLGLALAIPRFLDAVADPLMGNVSDNSRSRWGRRRPFIFAGGILCAIFFILLWCPPTAAPSKWLFAYFLGISIFYYLAYTVFSVPRNALGYELASDRRDRINLFAVNAVFAGATGLAIPWLYKLAFNPVFAGQEKNELLGARWVAIICGLLILASALPSVFLLSEKAAFKKQEKTPFFEAFRHAIGHRAFQCLTAIVFLVLLSVLLVGPLNLYIAIYYICGGDKETGAFWGGLAGTAQALSGIAAAPLIAKLAGRYSKIQVLSGGIIIAILGFVSTWWLYDPAHPWLQMGPGCLIQIGLGCVWVLNGAMIADICDDDEKKTGLRREGIFGAVFAFITKIAGSGVTLLAGFVLVGAGFVDAAHVTAATLWNLRVLYILIPTILLLIALLFIRKYPLADNLEQ